MLTEDYEESYSIDRYLASMKPVDLVTCSPRMAKDTSYANAIQEAWRRDKVNHQDKFKDCPSGTTISTPYSFRIHSSESQHSDDMSYGHVIRRYPALVSSVPQPKVPGILFFHTGAGPHDIFLQWKADTLANNLKLFPDGCVILIVDILGDDSGWAWDTNRTRYDTILCNILQPQSTSSHNDHIDTFKMGTRPRLQSKLLAAVNELVFLPHVDCQRLVAMGWCLGGHSISELARMELESLKAMITFHGVFGECPNSPLDMADDKRVSIGRTLIYHGTNDPFVSEISLENAVKTMKYHGQDVTVLQVAGAKHGFTNPAQDFNPNPSFCFQPNGADRAWLSALELLSCTIT
jgi:dienelactone hydrolase